MDIEGSEFESLELMLETDVLQTKVKQVAIEVHLKKRDFCTAEFYRRWAVLKKLEDNGFKRWYSHLNRGTLNFYNLFNYNGQKRSCCYEMVYINTAFLNKLPRSDINYVSQTPNSLASIR